jgi:hypothetical protein
VNDSQTIKGYPLRLIVINIIIVYRIGSDGLRVNVSRQKISTINAINVESIGASYTHIKSLKGIIGPKTKKIVMYHALVENLDGFEDCTNGVETVYLGFNRISKFREKDSTFKQIGTLDLAGNPIKSLEHCPPCDVLIVSSTLIEDLYGCPEGVSIIRCGHSLQLKSLRGAPDSVKIIECGCAPNLIIDTKYLPKGLEELIE